MLDFQWKHLPENALGSKKHNKIIGISFRWQGNNAIGRTDCMAPLTPDSRQNAYNPKAQT
ncbi:hypothetical protein D0T90_00855 [Neisseria animalis]|uniref:Uncharacterized protein n=1 Tax=Neisseria animalis TaxID=492 RepID=A0A5P3MR95_NEIAN|nr:hypothetical protein D0T90_00855 [Neisseria animalis]ROW32006.1 hypothetical protein CGZ60_07560 [Neisseria animalis]